jgi:hypothetical protein
VAIVVCKCRCSAAGDILRFLRLITSQACCGERACAYLGDRGDVRRKQVRLYDVLWTGRASEELCAEHRGQQASIQALWPAQPRSQSVGDREAARTAILYAFDLIEHDGEVLRHLPFLDRKAALARLLRNSKAGMLFNEHIAEDGPVVFAHACRLGAKGIVSKNPTCSP